MWAGWAQLSCQGVALTWSNPFTHLHSPQWLDSPPTRVTLSTQTDLDYLLANSIILNNEWMEFWIRPIPKILQINRGHLESVFIIGFVHWRALVSHKTATRPTSLTLGWTRIDRYCFAKAETQLMTTKQLMICGLQVTEAIFIFIFF